ncbi:hypothetical protein [Agrococcus sp. HG114]|uniref:hypothetical protein n=1 Tax=Agrococcus sp. HG114 TaxID=2969757 RepID=UPI00215A0F15|nr:hypothetical protein [Agrococcus sp. HG114]MCR8671284.1 hypothetical protein [Agrococcus sp. HG114]
MDAIFGIMQGSAIWLLALGLGLLVLGVVLLRTGRLRREKAEHGQRRQGLEIALIVVGAVLAVLGAVGWIGSLTTGG